MERSCDDCGNRWEGKGGVCDLCTPSSVKPTPTRDQIAQTLRTYRIALHRETDPSERAYQRGAISTLVILGFRNPYRALPNWMYARPKQRRRRSN